MTVDVELLYRQHLSEGDRLLLGRVVGEDAALSSAFTHPEVEAAVFGLELESDGLAATSPFLLFATAVHLTSVYLETASFVEERWTSRQRVPVFDVEPLRILLADSARRFFFAELLSSYTHVASGAVWERTRRGWRRRRFSELDPIRLAELLELVDERERPGIYRRLGDLALFLTGVFPDHSSIRRTDTIGISRLSRLAGISPDRAVDKDEKDILQLLGPRWYRMAAASALAGGVPQTTSLDIAAEIGEHFDDARRVLNVITDRYLFPLRERWFGAR